MNISARRKQSEVSDILTKSDEQIQTDVDLLAPLIETLEELKAELAEEIEKYPTIDISSAPHGHMATVQLKRSVSNSSFTVSRCRATNQFLIEEHKIDYIFGDNPREDRHLFSQSTDALHFLVEKIGEHVGAARAHKDRER